jgi:hypothetical protein
MLERVDASRRSWLTLVPLVALASAAASARADPRELWTQEMARAASAWVEAMGPRSDARIDFADAERRNWHYVPRARRGVSLRDMTDAQREAAWALVRSGLSERGYERAEATMALQTVLARREGIARHPHDYSFTVFGHPPAAPWGWRVEGHHLSVNVSVAAPGRASVTPLFTGARPARAVSGPRRGQRLHETEHRVALELVQSLDERRLAAATIADRPLRDIVAGPGRADALSSPRGLLASDMTPEQRARLLRLVEAYVSLAKDEWGRPYLELVRAGLAQTRFAWAGGRREGTAFYWRVHGPRVLIEFDHTQGDPDHVHSVWRDPLNDFARDDLREHYESGHGHTHR